MCPNFFRLQTYIFGHVGITSKNELCFDSGQWKNKLQECCHFSLLCINGKNFHLNQHSFLYLKLGIIIRRRRQWHPTPVLLPGKSHGWRSRVGLQSMGSPRVGHDWATFTFHFHALEKEMATHSSALAWRLPGMGEPGGLPSLGSHRVKHDWSDAAAAAAAAASEQKAGTTLRLAVSSVKFNVSTLIL